MKKINSGKVREIYEIDDDKLLLVVSDRISAYDYILPNTVPDKGKILNQLSKFWFDFTKDIIPNHVISTNLEDFPEEFRKKEFEGRSMLVKKLKMLPIECVARGYLVGSGWKDYKKTGCICGIKLPEGLLESQKFSEPLFTPAAKASQGHDENISFDRVVEIIGKELADKIKNITLELYTKCSEYAYKNGVIIADTKFEFGLDKDGNLVIGDEMFTPDSSRFWLLADYEAGHSQKSFDKQYLRDWITDTGYNPELGIPIPDDIINNTASKYKEAYKLITGKDFK